MNLRKNDSKDRGTWTTEELDLFRRLTEAERGRDAGGGKLCAAVKRRQVGHERKWNEVAYLGWTSSEVVFGGSLGGGH